MMFIYLIFVLYSDNQYCSKSSRYRTGTAGFVVLAILLYRYLRIYEISQRKSEQFLRSKYPTISLFTSWTLLPTLNIPFLQAVKVFTWFGWFCLYIYGSVWVATNIYHGVADSSMLLNCRGFGKV